MEKGKHRAFLEEKLKAEPAAECEDGPGGGDGEDDDDSKRKKVPPSSGSRRGSGKSKIPVLGTCCMQCVLRACSSSSLASLEFNELYILDGSGFNEFSSFSFLCAADAPVLGAASRNCQAEKCTADLTEARQYHRRHKVCEQHAKAPAVVVGGLYQRFCQQCSRFHELLEFDENKRSCRRRLAGHNERRRKNPAEPHIEGSSGKAGGSTQMKELVCGQVDNRGRIQENATYKHFQIR
ncbi:hypothetical protein EUGRSUZ_K01046 [Eucalyptus grandis]|uniref:Uncharacterized protein n=2 Tax=Eucalyptus grandis TaxID=71139 RepID=A0ACC3ISK9_EUCGR|nr:hypothetical protein EUGRSUZ_K01046 [Eucalyptus grandis]